MTIKVGDWVKLNESGTERWDHTYFKRGIVRAIDEVGNVEVIDPIAGLYEFRVSHIVKVSNKLSKLKESLLK